MPRCLRYSKLFFRRAETPTIFKKVLRADKTKHLRFHRPGVALAGIQKRGDGSAPAIEECCQRNARQLSFGQDKFLQAGARKPTKLFDELAHRAPGDAVIFVPGDMRRHIPLKLP